MDAKYSGTPTLEVFLTGRRRKKRFLFSNIENWWYFTVPWNILNMFVTHDMLILWNGDKN
jgi:hypothetical protein